MTETTGSDGFSASWLQLREPADHRARDEALTTALARWAGARSGLQVMELGTGTGSNLRYLCPKLGYEQQWLLLDHDALLLRALPDTLRDWAHRQGYSFDRQDTRATGISRSTPILKISGAGFSASIRYRQQDLAAELATLPFADTDLVTGAALLDLTSRPWLESLSTLCTTHGCACLFALSYDGRIDWHPVHGDDALLRRLLNAHQLGDKGFGTALGPAAGDCFADLQRVRHTVSTASSPWRLHAEDRLLQSELIEGWAAAAMEQAPEARERIECWRAARLAHLSDPDAQLSVGHLDILSLPTG